MRSGNINAVHVSLDTYGSLVNPIQGVFGRYVFTGRELDPATANYYYRAREFSPQLGRFTSQDPLRFDAGDTNLYRFLQNSSPNGTDPTGTITLLQATVVFSAINGAILGGGAVVALCPNADVIDILVGAGFGALSGGFVGYSLGALVFGNFANVAVRLALLQNPGLLPAFKIIPGVGGAAGGVAGFALICS